MEVFKLKEGEEYIQLNNLLKTLCWVATGGEAKIIIKQEEVFVNGDIETQIRRKIRQGDTVTMEDDQCRIE